MTEVLRIRISLIEKLERAAAAQRLNPSQLLCQMILRAKQRELRPENRNTPHRKMIGLTIDEPTEKKLALLATRFRAPKAQVIETIIGAAK